jgi:ATP-binding cassette subfamily A (ABC1) protein 3
MSPSEMAENCVVIKNVSYLSERTPKIRNFYLSVEDSSCLGILGSKKSGKNLLVKMIAGEAIAYKGDIFIKSLNIASSPRDLYQKIGYCPEYNAILKYLSGRENLEIFGLAKGIPRDSVQKELRSLADGLNFTEYLPKLVKNYSEAALRKLCIAIALMGDPTLVILDDPTDEMDPISRRYLFKILSKMRHDGKTIIFTSNNLKECEGFCNKLAIMVDGKLKCVGTPASLKAKYSDGMVVEVRLKVLEEELKLVQINEIKSFMERSIAGCSVR